MTVQETFPGSTLAASKKSAAELLNSALTNTNPTYASYSSRIYWTKHTTHRAPDITPDLAALEASAKERLPEPAFNYAVGGAGMESTVRANRQAFDEWRIVPRMLATVHPKRDLRRCIFGRMLPAPIVMAPVGVQKLFHESGERATAKVFGELGLPYTQSTASCTGFKDVAEAVGAGNPRWYQLYWPSDDDLTKSYLCSAKKYGFEVLVVTLDTWELGWRARDLKTGTFPFIDGIGTQIGLEDECAHQQLGFNALSPGATFEQKTLANLYHVVTTARGVSPTWANLAKLREWWGDGPIVLKGIQSPADAILAVEHGMDGIIVSNHGGRQVDGAIASLEALPDIVKAVKGKITIGFDSGIRCGADIFKALALGADFVQLGRPILWGLAHEGEKGVRHVLSCLLADFDLTVALSGCAGLSDITPDSVKARNSQSQLSQGSKL